MHSMTASSHLCLLLQGCHLHKVVLQFVVEIPALCNVRLEPACSRTGWVKRGNRHLRGESLDTYTLHAPLSWAGSQRSTAYLNTQPKYTVCNMKNKASVDQCALLVHIIVDHEL